MATGGSFANLTGALKKRYDDGFTSVIQWSKSPLAAMIKKVPWSGEQPVYSMRVGNSPARSATFSTAKTISESKFTQIKQARLDWVDDYARATIAGRLMKAAGDKMGSVYDQFVGQIDGIMDATMHSFSTKIYRDGYGSIGRIGSTTTLSGQTIVLATAEDVVLYEIGMRIQLSESNAGHVLRDSGDELIVDGIDFNAGTIHVTEAIDTVSSAATGDYIFASGDRESSATPSRLAIPGLAAWLPTSAPSSGENFYNLGDRNNDGRLLGVVVNSNTAGLNEEESLLRAVTSAGRYGGKPRHGFLNPTRYENLIRQGMSRFRPTTVKGPSGIGFSGVAVQTSYGDVEVYSDPYCPKDLGYVLDMRTWQFYGCGGAKVPDILNHDGNKILRQTDDDGVECRVGYYGAFGGNAPIQNAVINFAG